ncbi:MAG: hypothetical protein H7138_21585 [Myxococcales bacterium]|nr:hypothetical protein [Myxococcales bacterium]
MRLVGSHAVLVCVALAGCGDSPNAPPDTQVAIDAGIDAAVDAAIDAPPPRPTRVRVVMLNEGHPSAEIPVLFQRPDHSVVADVKTDANGVAEVEFPDGGTVSLFPTYSSGLKEAITYLGVKPGDVLEVGSLRSLETPTIQQITLKVPAGTPPYTVSMPCSGFASLSFSTPTVALSPCATTTRFLVRDADGRGLYSDPITLREGQVVDLSTDVLRAPRTITARGVGMPSPQVGLPGVTTETTDSLFTLSTSQFTRMAVADGAGMTSFEISDLPNVPVTTSMALTTSDGLKLWTRRQAPSAEVVFDFAQVGLAFSRDPVYADNTVRWTERGTGGDFAYAILYFDRPRGTERLRVSIFGPKTGSSLRIPTFPAPHTEFNPSPEDAPHVFRAGIARTTGGWDAARRYAHRIDFFNLLWLDGEYVFSE